MPGVTKFDTPAQAQFMNTYSPIPFAEMQQAVATRQGRLDENLARMDAANIQAQNLNYISNSEDERYIKGVVQPGMESIVTEFSGQDLSDPTVYNALRAKMSSTFDKSRVKDIQSSYAGWKQNQASVGKLKAAGKYQEALDLMNPAKGYDSRKGVYDYQTESALDIRKAAEQYFNNLRADTGWNPETGMVHSGISDAKIQQSATENIRTFLDTKEGEQAVRIAAHRMGVDYNKISREDREGFAMDVLMEVGDEFGYSSTTPMSGYASYMKGQKQPDVNIWQTPTSKGQSVKVRDHKDLTLPKDVGLQVSPTTSASIMGLTTQTVTSAADKEAAQSRLAEELVAEREKWQIPEGISDEEAVKKINNAYGGINNQSVGYKHVTAKAASFIVPNVLSRLAESNMTLYDAHGVSPIQKLQGKGKHQGVLGELGMTYKELFDEIQTGPPPRITQDGPQAGMYAFQISGDRNKKPRTLLIAADDPTAAMFGDSHQIVQHQQDLDNTPFYSETYGTYMRSVPVMDTSGDGQFRFKLEEGDMVNGQFVKTADATDERGNPLSLDRIKNHEFHQYQNSGIYGTDINYNPGADTRDFQYSPGN